MAAADAPSQAPAESIATTTAASPKKKSHLGAILGKVIQERAAYPAI